MAYIDLGAAERPIDAIFLHANGLNARTYLRILAPMADRYRVLLIDQRGHGATTLETTPEVRRDWLDLRDDLLAFLDVARLERVVLSGHSMGATTCLLAAAEETSRCRGLVLFDPVILPPRVDPLPNGSGLIRAAARRRAIFPNREEAMKSYRGRGAFENWPNAVLADYVAAGFRDLPSGEVALACTPAWEASGFAAQGHDSWDALARTKCPINILQAEKGSTFRTESNPAFDRRHVRISTVQGSTHFLPMEHPELVRTVLSKAIEATPSTRTRKSTPA